MAKKTTIASEIGSALGAVAARAEQVISSNTKKAAKPAAKKPAAAKHASAKKVSITSDAIPVENENVSTSELAVAAEVPAAVDENARESFVAHPAPLVITRELVAEQAYLYWELRGYQGGDPLTDWVRAEEELKERAAKAAAV